VTVRPTVHILSQYAWPDDAPTGIYAEQLADAIAREGLSVRLVGGHGQYRRGRRPAPRTRIERVAHFEGSRGRLVSTAREYESVRKAFGSYIGSHVGSGDIVIVTSAPPTTLLLERTIRERGALGVYWLQDYYPQLIRGVWDAPASLRRRFDGYFTRQLAAWPHVVKAAGNLGYHGSNSTVIRNWNTLDLGPPAPFRARTALYSGNLGYGHDVPSFVAKCRTLHEQGYAITVRGDGPGIAQLPSFIHVARPFVDPEELIRSYWEAEVHLIAGHPLLGDAVFPSKFWNAQATGRPVLATGFAGALADELEIARSCDFHLHLPKWTQFLLSLVAGDRARGSAS
jgi:putative colanic acid biosynthesis glycosyltransferase WcaI